MSEENPSSRPGRPKDTVKREDIVTAATELFMENGYELTSMEAVARKAGVSKLTIYSHFADKSELFRAIIQHRCDCVGMPESFNAESRLSPEDALLAIARHATSIMYRPDSLRLMRVLQAEVLHHPEVVRAYYEVGPSRIKTAFTNLMNDFTAQGKLSVANPVHAAEQFFSLLKGERMQRTLMMMSPPPDQAELEEHIRATIDLFLAYYRPTARP